MPKSHPTDQFHSYGAVCLALLPVQSRGTTRKRPRSIPVNPVHSLRSTLRKASCPSAYMNHISISVADTTKYLDRRFNKTYQRSKHLLILLDIRLCTSLHNEDLSCNTQIDMDLNCGFLLSFKKCFQCLVLCFQLNPRIKNSMSLSLNSWRSKYTRSSNYPYPIVLVTHYNKPSES